jgi:timeless
LVYGNPLIFNRELFDVTLRLLVNLTNPELLLFKEELPEDKETRNFYLQIQTQRQVSDPKYRIWNFCI